METICFTKRMYGVPCPSCGLTRSFLAIWEGDWDMAFHFHPLFFLVPIFFFLSILQLLQKFSTHPRFPKFILKIIPSPFVFKISYLSILALFIGAYILRMILFFPDTPPMDFYEDNLLSKLLKILNL